MSDCMFFRGNECCILNVQRCIGYKCSFRKTIEEFEHNRDAAIRLNRAKGNCVNCKYVTASCRLNDEPDTEEDY